MKWDTPWTGGDGTPTLAAMGVPTSDIDLWSDEALEEPYPLWSELRQAGPAVFLERYGIWALPRFAEVKEALRDHRRYTSAEGVTLNETMNGILSGIMLHTDPPEHEALREVVRRPMLPAALRALEGDLQAEAEAMVTRLVSGGPFDAAGELASHLPLSIVSARVGLPEEGRERMLDWGFANFQCFGPMNERTRAWLPVLDEAVAYMSEPTLRARLVPGGWADALWHAGESGEIPLEKCPVLMNDYWGPSLDTTIFGISSAVLLFARHPEQWELVRSDPSLLPHAVNETLRLESPISQFSRVATSDVDYDGVRVPAGSRVLVMFGSANRDERRWPDPERFDVLRRPSDHLAFGFGEHHCAGQALARLEMRAVLGALAARVERFEILEMERARNNTLRGLSRLVVRPLPAR